MILVQVIESSHLKLLSCRQEIYVMLCRSFLLQERHIKTHQVIPLHRKPIRI
ncbi:hypothetical protein JHK86_022082 [Glycine max]|nr:hypothetical protein JHK86_022082 [Glycine max]